MISHAWLLANQQWLESTLKLRDKRGSELWTHDYDQIKAKVILHGSELSSQFDFLKSSNYTLSCNYIADIEFLCPLLCIHIYLWRSVICLSVCLSVRLRPPKLQCLLVLLVLLESTWWVGVNRVGFIMFQRVVKLLNIEQFFHWKFI
jgi:hypothetical protein